MTAWKDIALYLLLVTLALAALLRLEWRTDEASVVLALLLLLAGTLGLAQPRWFVLTGLLVGWAIPLAHFLSDRTGYMTPAYQVAPPSTWDVTVTILLVIPALLAAACGALLRRRLWPA